MNTLEKAELTSSVHHIEIFKIRNTDLQFRIRMAEKQEEGRAKEHRRLQSVVHFPQTQYLLE